MENKSRNWLMTLNNPTEPGEDYLNRVYKETKAKYCVGQLEKGKEGTIHI